MLYQLCHIHLPLAWGLVDLPLDDLSSIETPILYQLKVAEISKLSKPGRRSESIVIYDTHINFYIELYYYVVTIILCYEVKAKYKDNAI